MLDLYIPEFLALYTINVINLISPGAGCALMVRNSTYYSRRVAIMTAIGITLSSFIHKTYALLGFGMVVAKTPWLFYTIQYGGAAYLSYLAYTTALIHFSTKEKITPKNISSIGGTDEKLTPFQGLRMGFIVDMLNPMASISFVCIVVATVSVETPLKVRFIYLVALIMTSLVWYLFLAFFFSLGRLKAWALKMGKALDLTLAAFLLYLVYKLLMLTPKV